MELSKIQFDNNVPIIIKRKVKISKDKVEYLYFNTKNGKMSYELEEIVDIKNDHCIVDERKSSLDVGIIDIKYDKNKDLLIVMLLKFNAGKVYAGTIREAKEIDRIYIKRDKTVQYKKTRWEWDREKRIYHRMQDETYSEVAGYNIGTDIPFIMNKYYILSNSCYDEINKMFPRTVTLSGNKLLELNDLNNFYSFIKYKEPQIKNGPKQKEVDELVKIPLEELTNIPDRHKFAIISKLNKEDEAMCVLRTFLKTDSGTIYEGGRIYIGKKRIVSCKRTNDNKYIKTSLLAKPEHWNFAVEDFNPENSKGTKLEYFGEILSEIDIENRGLAVWAFIKWDITEKMFKSEFKDLMKEVLKRSIYINPINYLENQLGKFSGDKNIYKNLGVNKYQASVLLKNIDGNLEYNYDRLSPILVTKILLSGTRYISAYSFIHHYGDEHINIANIDNETFDKAYALANKLDISDYRISYFINIFGSLSRLYGVKTMLSMQKQLLEIWDLLRKDVVRSNNYWHVNQMVIKYKDYLEMVDKIGDNVNFKAQFKTVDDITKMHDAACIIFNLQKDRISKEKFEKNLKKWTKWEFENDEYCIIAPKGPNELAKEGLELHHCVKSYIDRVSDGITNILFLRKKNEIDKPFYTIEISNSGTIEQIHGTCNCNIDTNPEIIPFLQLWFKEKKLKTNNINKVR